MAKDIRVSVFGRTDLGRTRDHNEDTFLVADLDAPQVLPSPHRGRACHRPAGLPVHGRRRHGRRGGGRDRQFDGGAADLRSPRRGVEPRPRQQPAAVRPAHARGGGACQRADPLATRASTPRCAAWAPRSRRPVCTGPTVPRAGGRQPRLPDPQRHARSSSPRTSRSPSASSMPANSPRKKRRPTRAGTSSCRRSAPIRGSRSCSPSRS